MDGTAAPGGGDVDGSPSAWPVGGDLSKSGSVIGVRSTFRRQSISAKFTRVKKLISVSYFTLTVLERKSLWKL